MKKKTEVISLGLAVTNSTARYSPTTCNRRSNLHFTLTLFIIHNTLLAFETSQRARLDALTILTTSAYTSGNRMFIFCPVRSPPPNPLLGQPIDKLLCWVPHQSTLSNDMIHFLLRGRSWRGLLDKSWTVSSRHRPKLPTWNVRTAFPNLGDFSQCL